MLRFRGGAAMLLICLSLPMADRLSQQAGAEMAAFWVFAVLFMALIAAGLLMDALWRPGDDQGAGRGYDAKAEHPSQT